MTSSVAHKRVAVVLFNLGGPDSLSAVQPFLFNLFKDKFIIRLPALLRQFVAYMIAKRRTPEAQKIYEHMGGKSPILENTLAQARALEERLGEHYKVFVCMRHWHPMSDHVAMHVKEYNPDQVILLPLYPQFSTTTTASALEDWKKQAKKVGLRAPVSGLCCYPTDGNFVAAQLQAIRDAYWKLSEEKPPRILFSAHGLPEKIVKAGDPYAWQVEQSVKQIISILHIQELDWQICYQSRVGPLAWLEPSTPSEIARAGRDKKSVLLVPITFVSEHSETLVELDIEYKTLAAEAGVPVYERVPTLGVQTEFIDGLAALCQQAENTNIIASHTGKRLCPRAYSGCVCTAEAA